MNRTKSLVLAAIVLAAVATPSLAGSKSCQQEITNVPQDPTPIMGEVGKTKLGPGGSGRNLGSSRCDGRLGTWEPNSMGWCIPASLASIGDGGSIIHYTEIEQVGLQDNPDLEVVEHRVGDLNAKKTIKASLIKSIIEKKPVVVKVYDYGEWKSGPC